MICKEKQVLKVEEYMIFKIMPKSVIDIAISWIMNYLNEI